MAASRLPIVNGVDPASAWAARNTATTRGSAGSVSRLRAAHHVAKRPVGLAGALGGGGAPCVGVATGSADLLLSDRRLGQVSGHEGGSARRKHVNRRLGVQRDVAGRVRRVAHSTESNM